MESQSYRGCEMMDYTKLTWKELLRRKKSPPDTPDYQKAKDEIWRRLTIWGLVIAALSLMALLYQAWRTSFPINNQMNEQTRLRKVASDLAEDILANAVKFATQVEQECFTTTPDQGDKIGVKIDDAQFQAIVLEFTALQLHISDRETFKAIGPSNRAVFMDIVAGTLNELGTKSPMSEQHSLAAFSVEVKPGIRVEGLNVDFVNQRQTEYAAYRLVQPRRDKPLRGTLFWEFGKHVAGVAHPHAEGECQALAAFLGGEAYLSILAILEKLNHPWR